MRKEKESDFRARTNRIREFTRGIIKRVQELLSKVPNY